MSRDQIFLIDLASVENKFASHGLFAKQVLLTLVQKSSPEIRKQMSHSKMVNSQDYVLNPSSTLSKCCTPKIDNNVQWNIIFSFSISAKLFQDGEQISLVSYGAIRLTAWAVWVLCYC